MNRIFLISLSFYLSGCSLFDSEAIETGFLTINSITVRSTNNQGANTSHIQYAWVYSDGKPLGVYPLPARVPIPLNENPDKEIRIAGGIAPNGINSTSEEYPFYNPFVSTISFSSNPIQEISPILEIREDAKFDLIEGFETGNRMQADLDGNINTSITRSTENPKSGIYCGKITLTEQNDQMEAASETLYPNSNNAGGSVYLEIDFKGNVPLLVGAQVGTQSLLTKKYKVGLKPTDEWKKFYIDLTDIISVSNVSHYRPIIGAALADTVTSAEVFVDNIKLIHF